MPVNEAELVPPVPDLKAANRLVDDMAGLDRFVASAQAAHADWKANLGAALNDLGKAGLSETAPGEGRLSSLQRHSVRRAALSVSSVLERLSASLADDGPIARMRRAATQLDPVPRARVMAAIDRLAELAREQHDHCVDVLYALKAAEHAFEPDGQAFSTDDRDRLMDHLDRLTA